MKPVNNAKTHIFRQEPVYPGEHRILSKIVQPGMKVLDIGCAATGRSARLLKELGCDVYSIEINVGAISEFKARPDSDNIHLTAANMCALPFRAGYFSLVLIAFHGIDYLLTNAVRVRAFHEINRVLAEDGTLVFNSFNRAGVVLSPSGLRSKEALGFRLRHIARFGFLKPTLVDLNCLEMHQSLPRQIIKQVESATDLTFDYAINPNGSSKNLLLLTLFSTGPYFVFSR